MIVNLYSPDIGTCKYIKQTLLDIREKINNNIIIVGDFNSPLMSMDR